MRDCASLRSIFVYCVISCTGFLLGVVARDQPYNACRNYFRYEQHGGQWVGIISPQSNAGNVSFAVTFSVQGVHNSDILSNLEPYPNKLSSDYRIYLYGSGSLPKITKFELNGQVLCESDGYPPPSTQLTRIQRKYTITSVAAQNFDLKDINIDLANVFASLPTGTKTSTNNNPWLSKIETNTGNANTPSIQLPDWILQSLGGAFDGTKNPVIVTNFNPNTNTNDNINTNDVHRIEQCGYEGLVPFQHGGVELERGRFPWLSAIYHDSNPNPGLVQLVHKCSGSLVSTRSVITAAHCVFNEDPNRIRVYLGRYDLGVYPEDGAVLKELEKIQTHPDYTHHIIPEADVALLILSTPVEITKFIRPICIWRSSDWTGSDSGQTGSVAGWGIDENGNKPVRPKVVTVDTVSQATCLRDMDGAKEYLTDRTICAGNSNRHGPCLGDSGGGLMIQRNRRWLLRAVISLGSRAGDQCDLSQYVIYCDLAKHIDWIQKNVV